VEKLFNKNLIKINKSNIDNNNFSEYSKNLSFDKFLPNLENNSEIINNENNNNLSSEKSKDNTNFLINKIIPS